jgi:predicted metal-dependent hydrolase
MSGFVQLALDWLGGHATRPQEDKPVGAPHLPAVVNEATFIHPLATRHIQLQETTIAYAFQRAKRKTIGMSVGADGLEVRAPRWATVSSVEAVLHEKSSWILRKLQESQERQKQMKHTIIEWKDGAQLPFLGEQLVVRLDPGHRFDHAVLTQNNADGESTKVLQVALSLHAQPGQIRDAVQAWLMQQAKQFFSERLNHFAPQLGVQWTRLSLSNASSRWGTASADGSIRLNWRLIHFKQEVIDYVVVHELSHLRVMNHSPQFWETVGSLVPDYQQQRNALNAEVLPQWA